VVHEGRLLLVEERDRLLANYAQNVAILELDPASLALSKPLADQLERMKWFSAITIEGSALRLTVNDLEKAKEELLGIIAQSGVVLNRYEWVRPTLEDVFLTISAQPLAQ
jgi:ABC-2 type transport system ATP-binding protein